MAKKYVNGYDRFQIRVVNDREETIYNFSFKYQALNEYYEKISIVQRDISGNLKKKILRVDYEWRIFYSESIEKDDLLKFQAIENAETDKRIYLTPHIDFPWREFEVIILDEKRTIATMPHGRGIESTLNYGFEISFVNKWAIQGVSMIDPDRIPVISALAYQEF